MYELILDVVVEITEIGKTEILSSKKEDCVNARYLLINKLLKQGMTESYVMKQTGLSQQCINKIKNSYEARKEIYHILTINEQLLNNTLTSNSFVNSLIN